MTDKLPEGAKKGVLNIGNLKIKVYILDDGQRMVDEESLKSSKEWLKNGSVTDAENLKKIFDEFMHQGKMENLPKRYYYTDLIKAVYMAKEFGVKFCIYHEEIVIPIELEMHKKEDTNGMVGSSSRHNSLDISWLTPVFGWSSLRGRDDIPFVEKNWFDNRLHDKYYVAKESESIFDIRIDDYFISSDPMDGEGSVYQCDSPEHETLSCEQIIMRDRKHFMAPEVEELEC